MTRHETSNSLIRALNVINTALTENKERRPWSLIVDKTRKQLAGEKLVVAVQDDRSDSDREEKFVVQVRNDRFCLLSDRPAKPDTEQDRTTCVAQTQADWKVTTRYLDDLACRAKYYVEHPSRIGLDWLMDRLGLGAPG